jgi:hypothetical protein
MSGKRKGPELKKNEGEDVKRDQDKTENKKDG